MKFLRYIREQNQLLYAGGMACLVVSFILILAFPFNETEVLGINSLIKPLKFSLSIWILCWTMAFVFSYYSNQRSIKRYSLFTVVVMGYELLIITGQALRGELSHFNNKDLLNALLYNLMGILIVSFTVYTLVLTRRFGRQNPEQLSRVQHKSLLLGLYFFVIFSFWGGLMGALNTHTIGGELGDAGLPMINWSIDHGDLRVAHFFGIHALQFVPLFGWWAASRFDEAKGSRLLSIAAWAYFTFVVFTSVQSLLGIPLISLK